MRNVVDGNGSTKVVKLHGPTGAVSGYNVEDWSKMPGKAGFVLGFHKTLVEARKAAGCLRPAPVNETAPKSSYPEQQDGYKKDTTNKRK